MIQQPTYLTYIKYKFLNSHLSKTLSRSVETPIFDWATCDWNSNESKALIDWDLMKGKSKLQNSSFFKPLLGHWYWNYDDITQTRTQIFTLKKKKKKNPFFLKGKTVRQISNQFTIIE